MCSKCYFGSYESPVGRLTLVANETAICGVYFDSHRPAPCRDYWIEKKQPQFDAGREWLARYFSGQGKALKYLPPIWSDGTDFQKDVWRALLDIPWGQTITYAQLAEKIGRPRAVRAVGAAVGRNPLSIMVPCHRVIGSGGQLTGYAGGLDKKRWLLAHENSGL